LTNSDAYFGLYTLKYIESIRHFKQRLPRLKGTWQYLVQIIWELLLYCI